MNNQVHMHNLIFRTTPNKQLRSHIKPQGQEQSFLRFSEQSTPNILIYAVLKEENKPSMYYNTLQITWQSWNISGKFYIKAIFTPQVEKIKSSINEHSQVTTLNFLKPKTAF